jgi:hypothetical protein
MTAITKDVPKKTIKVDVTSDAICKSTQTHPPPRPATMHMLKLITLPHLSFSPPQQVHSAC